MREVLMFLESGCPANHCPEHAEKMRETLERWRNIANHIDQLTAIKKLREEIEEVLK